MVTDLTLSITIAQNLIRLRVFIFDFLAKWLVFVLKGFEVILKLVDDLLFVFENVVEDDVLFLDGY